MGKMNLAVNRLLQRKSIYADLMNGTIFNGQQNLTEDDLEWIPIIIIVLYTRNKESWDGPRSLMQMCDMLPPLKSKILKWGLPVQ